MEDMQVVMTLFIRNIPVCKQVDHIPHPVDAVERPSDLGLNTPPLGHIP
tara:strand:+ start:1383 stop:1529 length:147 start_codon:yes stop_codon:yes gene_type:complete